MEPRMIVMGPRMIIMWSSEAVVQVLRERGMLWEAAPGLVGLRGSLLALYRALEQAIAADVHAETNDEWRVPAGLTFETLARAEYFASFPQWLTVACHLSDDSGSLERVATAADPAAAIDHALARPDAALPPAVCYHVYAAASESTITSPTILTAQGTCWRHEGERLAPLERGWAFTMREIVCLGTAEDVESFRRRGLGRTEARARKLGLDATVVEANDPFFAPTARGKALLQRVKALKQELVCPLGPDRSLAIASGNNHECFFGEAFDIRLPDGTTAASACVAYGIERWTLAYVIAHGPDPDAWSVLDEHSAYEETITQ